MSPLSNVESWASSRGFLKPRAFAGTHTKVGPNPDTRYAGFYLLAFHDGTYYLGESVSLRSRMGQHNARWGNEVASVQIYRQNLSKRALKKVEKTLIHELNELAPQRCRNIMHANVSFGVNELTDFLTVEEQQQWERNPFAFNRADSTQLKPMTIGQEVKYSTAARQFSELPTAPMLVEHLRTYLDSCVPAPRRTEFQSWSVSTGTYGGKRAFCVSVGKMESFVTVPDGGGFVVVRESLVFPTPDDEHRFTRRQPGVAVYDANYDDAGPDTVRLVAPTSDALNKLINDPTVQQAAAKLVLDVMRKHPSVYTRYHCPQLVEMVYSEFTRPTPEAPLIETERSAPTSSLSPVHDEDALSEPFIVEELADDAVITWFVNAGPVKTRRNSVDHFLAAGEWRMDPQTRYEFYVQDMLPGERIVVRKRYNTKHAPFDNRGLNVSSMDLLLTGTISANPGDGCSVKVDWDRSFRPRTWYLYTNQDPVWAVVHGRDSWSERLLDFALNDAPQDLEFWRNAPYWRKRFGDPHPG
ncbi:GIY-YIG nuclease family protein [Gordonia sp. (in: high G+C Gram-positive bacteria)]|uniref:GIY-YIG nuclease family protein n=1 Tax=Gordonia sp. (in: high G+C Gram-positive bacteria) TaxID=84139 RepID=UPI00260E9599|nr:GIY-YIG nuclease family protein [Gordonia sp. (in: high G+C Gram-positive bacteria)]